MDEFLKAINQRAICLRQSNPQKAFTAETIQK